MNKVASAFEIKSARIDALVVDLRDATIESVNAALSQRFGKMPDASSVPLLIDLSHFAQPDCVDTGRILALFNHYNLNVVGIQHTNKNFEAIANKHKLSFNLTRNSSKKNQEKQEQNNSYKNTARSEKLKSETNLDGNVSKKTNQTKISTQEVQKNRKNIEKNSSLLGINSAQLGSSQNEGEIQNKIEARPSMIIRRPVRTGQQVYAKNADLIVLDLVSPGAELLADGNIHVYAPLRGRALAGVSGDRQARIFVQCMQAELVSIAGVYRTIDQGLPQDIANKPAQICIEQEKLVIKSLK